MKKAIVTGALASSVAANPKVYQTSHEPNAGLFTDSPNQNMYKDYPSYEESLGDYHPSYLTEGNGKQGTFHDIYEKQPFHDVHQTGYDNKAGVFVKKDSEILEHGIDKDDYAEGRDYEKVASELRDYNPEYKTTGQNPGIFKTDEWDNAGYGGKKRTKRYRRHLTHRKKKTMKRRKTRKTRRTKRKH